MNISVKGFKSIKALDKFDFKKINLLAGINSSGKTSLSQCLLLLKQTIESDNKSPLNLTGPYVTANLLVDLIYNKGKILEFCLEYEREDVPNPGEFDPYFAEGEDFDKLSYTFTLRQNGKLHLSELNLILYGNKGNQHFLSFLRKRNERYQISTNNYKLLGMNEDSNNLISKGTWSLEFTNFFPLYAESGINSNNVTTAIAIPIMKQAMSCFKEYFRKIVYIGPIRVKPEVFEVFTNTPTQYAGIDGKYTRFVLHEYKKELLENTRYWICERLKLAKDIKVSKDANNAYRITLENSESIQVDLCHMGFGISQILPIIVQGLLVPPNGLFIIDAPEVHMHPYIQSEMVDFFIDLTRQRKVMIETHSEHIVTRLRRRIAEGALKPEDINLCFVENNGNGSQYQTLSINDKGSFYGDMPKGFMNTMDDDFKAIIKAKYQIQ